MNMITLAARAILKRRYYEPEFHPDLESFYASCYPEHVMEAEAEARAVIEVMREPTPEMIREASDGPNTSARIWRSMIDAALASPPTPEDAGER